MNDELKPSLDHVVLAVADLDDATAAYVSLLARAPSWRGVHPGLGTCNTLFRLDNTYLELLASAADGGPLADLVTASLRGRAERPFALALGVADLAAAVASLRARGIAVGDPADGAGSDDGTAGRRTWRSAFVDPATVRGLRLLLIEHTAPPDALPLAEATSAADTACTAIDHVVVFSDDLEASLALWTERLGLAVRWREDFPARGTRNVGLDLGGIVLELITRREIRAPSGRDDVLWGVAYRVADCAGAVTRVRASGLETSDVLAGLTAGTEVTSVRWPRTASLLISTRRPPT